MAARFIAARRAFSNVASSSMAIEKKAAEAHATGMRVGCAPRAAQTLRFLWAFGPVEALKSPLRGPSWKGMPSFV